MSEMTPRVLPDGFVRGPAQGLNIIGEITESIHRFLKDGWTSSNQPPRIEEDLSFVPKDREEVIYVYMYKGAQNTSLMNSKQWRPAKVSMSGDLGNERLYYERAPLYLELYYLVAVHSKFRSEAERLLAWVLMRLYDATHLVYRPRRYTLPDNRIVDSTGAPWSLDADGDDVVMEKVGLSLIDDLTLGDAINFFTINEAPFRPYLTYRAQCAMEGPLIEGPSTTVRMNRADTMQQGAGNARANGRVRADSPQQTASGRTKLQIGPPGHGHRPIEDNNSED